ncbi:MAG: hypothetical protein ACRYFU_24780 [Janthinobacterium lividum]
MPSLFLVVGCHALCRRSEQATVRHDTGAALYTQVEFAYGPLLLLPEIWLSSLLHCSITTAYFITLVIESSLGLLMLVFIRITPGRAFMRSGWM